MQAKTLGVTGSQISGIEMNPFDMYKLPCSHIFCTCNIC